MSTLRVATIPASLRAGSLNRKLLKIAELHLAKEVEVDSIELKEFPLPPYDGDIHEQQGIPKAAEDLKDRLRNAHGVIISAPEYNWGVAGMWKNIFDWSTRGKNQPWRGKVVGLMGVSNGPWGTWRATPHYREMHMCVGSIVLPQSFNLQNGPEVWDKDGNLLDESLHGRVGTFIGQYLKLLRQIHRE